VARVEGEGVHGLVRGGERGVTETGGHVREGEGLLGIHGGQHLD